MISANCRRAFCVRERVSAVLLTHCRHLRTYWERGLAKDLYHRRQLIGPEPVVHRSVYPNWSYPSEISALKHRLGIPQISTDLVVRALTNTSYFTRNDISESGQYPQPSNNENSLLDTDAEVNDKLLEKGLEITERLTLGFLRCHFPLSPEEFICKLAAQMLSEESMSELATSLGINHLVRTGEFPPTNATMSNAVYALVGAMSSPQNAQHFVLRFILPRLGEISICDVLPFRHPLTILTDYLNRSKIHQWRKAPRGSQVSEELNVKVEPRLLQSGGAISAMPFYLVGIYANGQLMGQSAGERLSIAVDLAAQDALLKLWNVSNDNRVFPFKNINIYQESFKNQTFNAQNHSLREVCRESTNLDLYSPEELLMDPVDLEEQAIRYQTQVADQVGIPYRKRLMHKFSRGTFTANTQRKFVKPTPFKI
ncbi:hypothetical protein Ddc_07594 [Ditylenchus destructor]|nr:hypothetical protein Ddc_07594 [Ditylenchus destructor]